MSSLSAHKTDFNLLDRPDMPGRVFAAGETIIAEGGAATEMYLVRSGMVEIRVHGKPVEQIGPGGIFGEMALIDRAPRSATAVAVAATEVMPIDQRLFVILVQDTPYFALDVMRILVERIRSMNAVLLQLV